MGSICVANVIAFVISSPSTSPGNDRNDRIALATRMGAFLLLGLRLHESDGLESFHASPCPIFSLQASGDYHSRYRSGRVLVLTVFLPLLPR